MACNVGGTARIHYPPHTCVLPAPNLNCQRNSSLTENLRKKRTTLLLLGNFWKVCASWKPCNWKCFQPKNLVVSHGQLQQGRQGAWRMLFFTTHAFACLVIISSGPDSYFFSKTTWGRGKKGSPLEEAQIQFSGRRTTLQIVQAHRVHVHGNSKVQAQPTKAKLVGKREPGRRSIYKVQPFPVNNWKGNCNFCCNFYRAFSQEESSVKHSPSQLIGFSCEMIKQMQRRQMIRIPDWSKHTLDNFSRKSTVHSIRERSANCKQFCSAFTARRARALMFASSSQ